MKKENQVTTPLLCTIAVIALVSAWIIPKMSADIETNKTDITRLDGRMEVLSQSNRGQAVALARIEETLKSIHETLKRIEPGRR